MKKYRDVQYGKKVVRRNYSKVNFNIELPNLIKTQIESFNLFLEKGIQESLKDISPIESYNGDLKLYFDDCFLTEPKLSIQEARKRDFSYCAELFANVRLENVITGETQKSCVFMTDLPLMTPSGTFVINGTERVVIAQIIRSAGAYFTEKFDVKFNKMRFEGQIIPTRGVWIEYEQSNKDILYVKLDRSKKISLTKFIYSLGFNHQQEIEEVFGKHELLELSFNKEYESNTQDAIVELYSKLHQGEKVSANAAREFIRTRLFDPKKYDLSSVGRFKLNNKLDILNRIENTYLAQDIKNVHNKEILFPKGTFLTKNIIGQLKNQRHCFRVELLNTQISLENEIHKGNESTILAYFKDEESNNTNIYLKEHILNNQTGEILIEADTLVDEQFLNLLSQNQKYLDKKIVNFFLKKNPLKQTLKLGVKKKSIWNEVLNVYVLDDYNNKKIIKVIGNDQTETKERIILSDIIASISYYLNLYNNIGKVDDIDYLGNRRLRLVGELLKNQFRIGLTRSEKNIKDRMSASQFDSTTPGHLVNFASLSSVIKAFFGRSRLSHFMEQINPLAILTQKRRISALGTGGIDRDRAGVEVRDVHNSYYGRLCPIETPEGPSIGLISSLATYAQVDKYGFIETPFLKVTHKNNVTKVTSQYDYLTSTQEEGEIIASADSLLNKDNTFKLNKIIARKNGETGFYEPKDITYMDVSPKQIVSVATSIIPFLEHNDASRALMGTNMQRQALPLLIPEAPIVGTGVEHRIVKDSGCLIVAEEDGYVSYVDAQKIIIKESNGKEKIYELSNFVKSNQNTLVLHRPLVKKNEFVQKGDILADGPATSQGELALGKNITVAFMTLDGYNYEDAVIISESLVHNDIYTSYHINKYEIQTMELKKGAGKEEITREVPNVSADAIKNLDERGVIIPGSEVKEGDILVGKIVPRGGVVETTPYEKLIQTIIGEKARDYKDASLRVPYGENGIVQSVEFFSVKNGDNLAYSGVNESVRIYIAKKRKIKEGDKIAGRHGNKGVISRILPKEDLPYMSDGTPIDIILNPLGVPSRMNIGQILEMHLGLAARKLNIKVATPVFDGVNNEDLKDIMKEANIPIDGKMILYDGRTGEPYDKPISVGVLYMIKLSHMVDDKLHARNVGPYTLITNQATRGQGISGPGGQRTGEMEVWSLYGYGAAHILQELLTVKSDDLIGRNKTYNAIVNGLPLPKPSIPQSFRVFAKELQALGLHVELIQTDTKENKANYSLVNNNK
ncbi:DNA-directed RNA polymerase subunit beta [Candidatus Phytoplasma phoenicium]|uniref:DNA-directed RNA polymerase subunit beta n=1 Tax=Candidatus Phytoplasma phoenicium TaxID=198422 RepID=A0A2S8NV43_9MOLU|nr:DNA-directed RNA polymerase subunit beta [Candidatus Phytoplasma phoenicium]